MHSLVASIYHFCLKFSSNNCDCCCNAPFEGSSYDCDHHRADANRDQAYSHDDDDECDFHDSRNHDLNHPNYHLYNPDHNLDHPNDYLSNCACCYICCLSWYSQIEQDRALPTTTSSTPAQPVTVTTTASIQPSTTADASSGASSGGQSAGTIVGIVAGVLGGVILVAAFAAFVVVRIIFAYRLWYRPYNILAEENACSEACQGRIQCFPVPEIRPHPR